MIFGELWFDDWTHDEIRYYRQGIKGGMILQCRYYNSPCKHKEVYKYCPEACEIWSLAWDNPRMYPKWKGEKDDAVSLPEE